MPTQSIDPLPMWCHSQICTVCDTNPAEGKSFQCVPCTMQLNGEI